VTADDRLDVAIIGYGPVGATLANLLGARGHRVAVLESTTSAYHLPRAAHFDGEVMRIFQAAGLADAIVSCTAPIAGMHFLNADGKRLFGYDAPQGGGRHGWADNYMFYQPDLERILRGGVDRFDNVRVYLAHEVIAVAQSSDHVRLEVRDREGDRVRAIRARYAIGCDGARSLTRGAAGISLEDLRFDQPWLVVDTVLTRPVDLPEASVQLCDPARPSTYVPMTGDRRRWEFMLLADETPEAMEDPARVRSLLRPWVAPEDVDVIRAVVYTFHAVIAGKWRNRRLLLAGDAAHQMPPFLGQGMCAGIRDALNLTWKLELVLNERADDSLLDSYEQERSPHVRTIIETAVNAGRIIQTTDPAVAAARDAHFLGDRRVGAGSIDDGSRSGGVRMPGLVAGVLSALREPPVGQLLPQPLFEWLAVDVQIVEF
jgi:3-(3-hydroxy-phenyl)propionate hydroxylase